MPGPGTGPRPGGWETLLYTPLCHREHYGENIALCDFITIYSEM